MDNVGYLIILASIFIIIALNYLKSNRSFFVGLVCTYSIGIFIPVCLMLASPVFPERVLFFTVTNAVIIFGLAYYNLDSNINLFRELKIVVLGLFSMFFVFDFYFSYIKIIRNNNAYEARERLIESKKAEGCKFVEVSFMSLDSKFVYKEYSVDVRSMSRYYGIKIIEKQTTDLK